MDIGNDPKPDSENDSTSESENEFENEVCNSTKHLPFSESRNQTIQSFHKKRLINLLRKLMNSQNWVDASGVLSVLHKATTKDKSDDLNRFIFEASLEVRKQMSGDTINFYKFKSIYCTWMRKVASVKERTAITLEYIIFCLSQGNVEAAHDAALSLMQNRGFETDRISNLVTGMTFYELWYSTLPKEWQLTEFNEAGDCMQPEIPEAGMSMSIENFDEVESQEDNFPLQTNSIASVANYKEDMEVNSDQTKEVLNDFYLCSGSGDEESSSAPHVCSLPNASIFYADGLPPWLLPIRLPLSDDNVDDVLCMHKKLQTDNYKNALKLLRRALHATPPVAEALHPLIQLLLVGDMVNEALDELENYTHDSCKALKLSLKMGLLEHFDGNNYHKLSECYEDILEIDPTSSYSLSRLVIMHRQGNYNMEKLVNMIALHLDGSYAEYKIWKEFAACLLKLSRCVGDQNSVCLNGGEDESHRSYSAHVYQVPNLFTYGGSANGWKLHCRWWLSRHFCQRILASEIAAGDLRLPAWKGAVATFLYGREFKYVVKVLELLKTDHKKMYSTLRMYVDSSVGFYSVS